MAELILPPLAAETIFHVGSFPVTNSYINSSLAVLVFVVVAVTVSQLAVRAYKKMVAPTGFLGFFEYIVEVLLSYADQVTGDRTKSIRFLPFVGSLFLFILVSNWAALLPGTGSLGRWLIHEGHLTLVPLLRPANADLNMTLAMAVSAVIVSHLFGIAAIGFWKYFNKFIKLQDMWKAVSSLNPIKILVAGIEFFVGLIEISSEVAKMVSLSLRLFGNVFAGEVLLTVLASLIAFFVPLPFIALEILVGLIQAVVFSMLTIVYLNMATMSHGHDEHEEHAEPHPVAQH